MATAKKPAAGAKKASPAKSAKSKSSSSADTGRATARGRGAGAAAKSPAKGAGKTAAKGASKTAAKGAAKTAAKSAAKAATKSAAKGAAKTAAKGASKTAAKGAAKTTAGKRGPNPAFMKPLQPDAMLAEVVGQEPMPRTQVVARVWEYIKKNGLQESRNINADDKLRPIFGKDQITMFEMMKLVNAHLSDVSAA
jgi:chromatin remodeling complex protein RSC6